MPDVGHPNHPHIFCNFRVIIYCSFFRTFRHDQPKKVKDFILNFLLLNIHGLHIYKFLNYKTIISTNNIYNLSFLGNWKVP